MSVMLSTSAGTLVVDLFTEECPIACLNFLKLCKVKYYNGCLFWNIQKDFIVQTGDPTGAGTGGCSVYGLTGTGASSFEDEVKSNRPIDRVGLVCMAHINNGHEAANGSQFFITLRSEGFDHLQGKHTVLGEIAEGLSTLVTLNDLYCDDSGRPFQDVRILHTDILHDPYPDPVGLVQIIPATSPVSSDKQPYVPKAEKVRRRIPYEKDVYAALSETKSEQTADLRRKVTASSAIVLEMMGDLPDADVKPPEEVLFVCKLNSVTTDEDLELIFSRFGAIKECSIVRDHRTGASMQYAFIEFAEERGCLLAYEKMNNVLIDDRRIKVDFSQSVAQIWNKFRRGKPRQQTSQVHKKHRSNSPNRNECLTTK